DTPYTWDSTRYDVKAECPDTPISDIADRVAALGVDVVILSGGEPLMHRAKLGTLFAELPGIEWHAETNGTIVPPVWWGEQVAHTTVSPKINTADPAKKRLKPAALAAWAEHAQAGRACFKFVTTSVEDVTTVTDLVAEHDLPTGAIWVMPEGIEADVVIERHRTLADAILAAGFNTTTRLHTLLWGSRRGV